MKQLRRSTTLTMALPTSGDDLPCSDRADFASAQWLWLDDTQPPFDSDGVEEEREDERIGNCT